MPYADPEARRQKQRGYQKAYRDRNKADPAYQTKRKDAQRRYYRTPAYAELNKDRQYMRKYNITRAERDQILADQGGRCAICKEDTKFEGGRFGANLDHCHITGKIRGVLCAPCNKALGLLKDNEAALEAALAYLRKAA